MSFTPSEWSHLSNFFQNATQGSNKKLDLLATDHHDKLSKGLSNPAINTLFTTVFKPAYDNFKIAYTTLLTAESRYSGRTRKAEETWDALRKNVDNWSFAIESTPGGTFRRGTINYSTIFPNGYAPIQTGGYEQRIRALKSTIEVAGDYPDLAGVVADMSSFYQNLLTIRTEQQGFEFMLSQARNEVDLARQDLTTAMHRVFGYLIYTFAPNTAVIDTYYDLSLLRYTAKNNAVIDPNISITADILPLSRRTVTNGDYSTTNFFEISNTGNTVLNIWISNNENSTEPINVFSIAAGDTIYTDSDALSDGSTDPKYIIVYNTDANNKGKISITKN